MAIDGGQLVLDQKPNVVLPALSGDTDLRLRVSVIDRVVEEGLKQSLHEPGVAHR
jgi:hypothetical protein